MDPCAWLAGEGVLWPVLDRVTAPHVEPAGPAAARPGGLHRCPAVGHTRGPRDGAGWAPLSRGAPHPVRRSTYAVLWAGLTAATTVGTTFYSERGWSFWWLNASYFLTVMSVNSIMLAVWR